VIRTVHEERLSVLSIEEAADIRSRYDEERPRYEKLSDFVRDRCLAYREQNPHVVRIVFSRQPKTKSLDSITQKIERYRANPDHKNFSYEQVADIVALTVLCPYYSDMDQFIGWLKNAFEVHAPENKPRRYPSGHEAWHFTVSPRFGEIAAGAFSDFLGLRCEIQVKTILQEAFDAKSHDLTYKPGDITVPDKLNSQFALLSLSLQTVDKQSEFLKETILEEQQEMGLRKRACLEGYLRFDKTKILAAELGFDLDNMPDVVEVASKLRQKAPASVSSDFCKFAATCALKLDHSVLKAEADRYTALLVEKNLHPLLVRSAILWGLGRYPAALRTTDQLIKEATVKGDTEMTRQGKNNFVYFVADWKLFAKRENAEWTSLAKVNVDELKSREQANEADTLALFGIVFGTTAEEIDEGRRLLRVSRQTRQDDDDIYKQFSTYTSSLQRADCENSQNQQLSTNMDRGNSWSSIRVLRWSAG
jgi:ppGpp synthetase/RelA/SpoT-type nucleotidyltranferase